MIIPNLMPLCSYMKTVEDEQICAVITIKECQNISAGVCVTLEILQVISSEIVCRSYA